MAAPTIELEAIQPVSWAKLCQRFAPQADGAVVAATPFQRGSWLQAWYDTLGAQPGVEPLPLEIRNAKTGAPIYGLPLVRRCSGNQTVVEFADATLTDYNAPLLGYGSSAAAPGVSPQALRKLLRHALPNDDLLRFVKMPKLLAGVPNPFTQLRGSAPSNFGTNVVTIDGSWTDYRKRLAKKVRKELERSFRVFERDGSNAEFRIVRDAGEALAVLERMELMQAERMRELGLPFVLNEPQFSAFYRRLLELDLSNGRLILSVLRSNPDELVGALLGIKDGDRYAMVRLAHAGAQWSHCSPGKLMIDRTMADLHSKGVTQFDFTTGDYNYKKGFLTESEALVDVSIGLSLSGRATLLQENISELIKNLLRRYPKMYAAVKSFAQPAASALGKS